LVPTTRGFAGNIVLGDIIVGVDNKTVSYLLLHDFLIFYGLQIGDIVQCSQGFSSQTLAAGKMRVCQHKMGGIYERNGIKYFVLMGS
jgi:hypothetical protein